MNPSKQLERLERPSEKERVDPYKQLEREAKKQNAKSKKQKAKTRRNTAIYKMTKIDPLFLAIRNRGGHRERSYGDEESAELCPLFSLSYSLYLLKLLLLFFSSFLPS